MKENSLAFFCAVSLLFLAQQVFADDQAVNPELAAVASKNKSLPPDPNVNPDYPFKSQHQSSGPVRIYFSYQHLQTRFSPKLNQLTVVTKDRLTGVNLLGGIGLVLGQYNSQTFSNRDSLVGYQITDINQRSTLENPALNDIPDMLDEKIAEYVKNTPSLQNRKYYEKLTVLPGQWSLVFSESATQPNALLYVLKFQATALKVIEGDQTSLFHAAETRGESCSFISEAKTLEQWKANDYAEVAALRPKLIGSCVDHIAGALPKILQVGETLIDIAPEQRVRRAKVMCKNENVQCIKIAKEQGGDKVDALKDCKEDYGQCQIEQVRPLQDATLIGQCKVLMNTCKTKIIDVVKSTSPDPKTKVARSELKGCVDEYKVCVDAAKNGKSSAGPEDKADGIDKAQ